MKSKIQKTVCSSFILACIFTLSVPPLKGARGMFSETSQSKGETGMYWPQDQPFPTFATPAETLDAIRVEYRSSTNEESVMFSALQGLVNREKPSIILLRQSGGNQQWPELLGLKLREYTPENKWELVRKYRDKVKGVILYSIEKSQHYRNLATTLAGIRDALPVTKAEYDQLLANNMNFNTISLSARIVEEGSPFHNSRCLSQTKSLLIYSHHVCSKSIVVEPVVRPLNLRIVTAPDHICPAGIVLLIWNVNTPVVVL